MITIDNKYRLLIISNNPLSNTNANGKTILSYFDNLPLANIRQLYFRNEKPSVIGYKYFRISDYDVIRGVFFHHKRGHEVSAECNSVEGGRKSTRTVKKNEFNRLLREILWWKKWKSKRLLEWLDDFSPTAVFFVGGDSGFAYDICNFIVDRYKARLSLYITDDYIMPRKSESMAARLRREYIKSKMSQCIAKADLFFTISDVMRSNYQKLFGVDSKIVVNMPDRIRSEKNTLIYRSNKQITLVYAGALNYGRDDTIHLIAEAIDRYNKNPVVSKRALLKVFTNKKPSDIILAKIQILGASEYGGSLGRKELNEQLNAADILVFVESFDDIQIEKTRFSLSTKVPEYLSAGKPIFAVGPGNIGSIEYLKDVSSCCTREERIYETLLELLNHENIRSELSEKAYNKYLLKHDKNLIQEPFVREVLGL